MIKHYLQLEAAHFDATVYDTQDLSTIRGSSAALLWAPGQVERWLQQRLGNDGVETIFTGASEGLFGIAAGVDLDELAGCVRDWLRGHALYKHFAFVVVTEPHDDDFPARRACLDTRRRFLRHRELTLVLPDASSPRDVGYCSVDRTRPAIKGLLLPKHRNEAYEKPPGVSRSVYTRHQVGRILRQYYYKKICPQLRGRDLHFSNEFAEIVGYPPKEVSATLESKVAVIQMDGNGFGKIRDHMIQEWGSRDGLREYSDTIKALRAGLVEAIVDWADCSNFEDGVPRPERYMTFTRAKAPGVRRIRFETLLWGGDEMFWVLPAWAAFDFIGLVQKVVADWQIADVLDPPVPLTHSAGMVLCNYKTPIRQAKALAEELSEGANARNDGTDLTNKQHGVQIQVLESVDIPHGYLPQYRSQLFGIGGGDTFRQRPFTFPGGAGWHEAVGRLRTLAGRLPRSQVCAKPKRRRR